MMHKNGKSLKSSWKLGLETHIFQQSEFWNWTEWNSLGSFSRKQLGCLCFAKQWLRITVTREVVQWRMQCLWMQEVWMRMRFGCDCLKSEQLCSGWILVDFSEENNLSNQSLVKSLEEWSYGEVLFFSRFQKQGRFLWIRSEGFNLVVPRIV